MTAAEILTAVLAAMQAAEEIGGPEGQEYVNLMADIETEAALRRARFSKRRVSSRDLLKVEDSVTKKVKKPTVKKRFTVVQRGHSERFYVFDNLTDGFPTQRFYSHGTQGEARAVADEFNRHAADVGKRVRIVDKGSDGELRTNTFGASEMRDLCHIVKGEWWGDGDEGVLLMPHSNQSPTGCTGWWYVEVDSKTEPKRKLVVCVWPGAFEVIS